ncbi:hypothetical protein ACFX13_020874 [Malus domestica]|uniref:PROP1-like PPR domain-containing protein n=1 Tax=Malus domestica TaxID=3750 RepID=A0A498HMC4_MALDO|nr:hypothetical protein DVH24_007577 [Malus domestica]
MCSRHSQLLQALSLYDEARSNGVPLSLHHYNVLLYLCSSNGGSDDGDVGLKRGFEISCQSGNGLLVYLWLPLDELTSKLDSELVKEGESPLLSPEK